MKPLLVIYTPLLDQNKGDQIFLDCEYFDICLRELSDEYRIIHLQFNSIETPRVELFSIDKSVTPLKLKEIEKIFTDRLATRKPFDEIKFNEILKSKRDYYGDTAFAIESAVDEYITKNH